jgi:hypothetical protein
LTSDVRCDTLNTTEYGSEKKLQLSLTCAGGTDTYTTDKSAPQDKYNVLADGTQGKQGTA